MQDNQHLNKHLSSNLQLILNGSGDPHGACRDWHRQIDVLTVNTGGAQQKYKFYCPSDNIIHDDNGTGYKISNNPPKGIEYDQSIQHCFYQDSDGLKKICKEIGLTQDEKILDFLMCTAHQSALLSLVIDTTIRGNIYFSSYNIIFNDNDKSQEKIECTSEEDGSLLMKVTSVLPTTLYLSKSSKKDNLHMKCIRLDQTLQISATIHISKENNKVKTALVSSEVNEVSEKGVEKKIANRSNKITLGSYWKKATEFEVNVFSDTIVDEKIKVLKINNSHALFAGPNADKNVNRLIDSLDNKKKQINTLNLLCTLSAIFTICSIAAFSVHLLEQYNVITQNIFNSIISIGKNLETTAGIRINALLFGCMIIGAVIFVSTVITKVDEIKIEALYAKKSANAGDNISIV